MSFQKGPSGNTGGLPKVLAGGARTCPRSHNFGIECFSGNCQK